MVARTEQGRPEVEDLSTDPRSRVSPVMGQGASWNCPWSCPWS